MGFLVFIKSFLVLLMPFCDKCTLSLARENFIQDQNLFLEGDGTQICLKREVNHY